MVGEQLSDAGAHGAGSNDGNDRSHGLHCSPD
jgi:hypothetical protein